MANTRRRLKDYKGFMITKINNYIYYATEIGIDNQKILKSYDLRSIKRKVDEYIKIF